jgi:hypothetical protein
MGGYFLFKHWTAFLQDRRYSRTVLFAVGIGAFLTLPFYWSFIANYQQFSSLNSALAEDVYVYSADVVSWLLPSGQHPFWGRWTAGIFSQLTTPNLMETTLFFGLIPLGLFVISLLFPRYWRRSVGMDLLPWQLLGLGTLILSFGPTLHFCGRTLLPWMPYRLFMFLPASSVFRIPSRLGITAILAIIVVAMRILNRIYSHINPALARVTLVAWSSVILFNMLFTYPYPVSSTRIPKLYQHIAEASGDSAVLELPAGESAFSLMSRYMYYQTYHQKPLVSGYLGRRPPRLHEQERLLPFVQHFFDPSYYSGDIAIESVLPYAVSHGARALDNVGIRYVVLHCPSSDASQFCDLALPVLKAALGEAVRVERLAQETLYLYQVTSFLPDMTIKLQSPQEFRDEDVGLYLLGWEWEKSTPEFYTWRTWWTCEGLLDEDYTLYLHYLDREESLIGQGDHLLSDSAYGNSTTSRWRCPGFYMDETLVPKDLLEDDLSIAFGLWVPSSEHHLLPSEELPIDEFGRVRIWNPVISSNISE